MTTSSSTSTRRCSAHCWYAQGPLCRCNCHGSNHGLLIGGQGRLILSDSHHRRPVNILPPSRRSIFPKPRHFKPERPTTIPMNLRPGSRNKPQARTWRSSKTKAATSHCIEAETVGTAGCQNYDNVPPHQYTPTETKNRVTPR